MAQRELIRTHTHTHTEAPLGWYVLRAFQNSLPFITCIFPHFVPSSPHPPPKPLAWLLFFPSRLLPLVPEWLLSFPPNPPPPPPTPPPPLKSPNRVGGNRFYALGIYQVDCLRMLPGGGRRGGGAPAHRRRLSFLLTPGRRCWVWLYVCASIGFGKRSGRSSGAAPPMEGFLCFVKMLADTPLTAAAAHLGARGEVHRCAWGFLTHTHTHRDQGGDSAL